MTRLYVASCRKRLTLYMVMRAVGDEEIMMIGWKLPIEKKTQPNADMLQHDNLRAFFA